MTSLALTLATDEAITIDVTSALKQGGGIGRATRGLIHGLTLIDQETPYRLLHTRDCNPDESWGLPNNFFWQALPFDERQSAWLWHRMGVPMPLEWIGVRSALYHGPDYVIPPLRRTPSAVTIHDLSFEVLDDIHEPPLRRYLQRAVPRSVQQASHLVAVSRSTRDELVRLYEVDPARITVVYSGVDSRFHPYKADDPSEHARLVQVREAFSLQRPFILCVATLEPRKNLSTLVRAFGAFRRAHPEQEVELLLAGGAGWLGQRERLEALVAEQKLAEDVRFLGFVSDELLPALLNEARLLVYPSLYEGFGLPVLEALACGLPVITARNSSLVEAGGDAARYIERATDDEALAVEIATVWTDEALRHEMIQRGLSHAARFTWQETARGIRRVYQRLLGI